MTYILFDCDGVLVDTEAVAAKVVTEWFKTKNYELSVNEFISQFTGKTFGAIFKELVEQGHLSQSDWKDDTIRTLEHTIYENIVVVNGIEECLNNLDPFEKAVISNSRAAMVKMALEHTGLEKKLDKNRIFSAEMVDKPKPDPGVYLLALEQLGKKAEECIAIEDSFTGVTAATKAGIKTLGFAGASHQNESHENRLLEAGAYAVAKSAGEIPTFVEEHVRSL